MDEHDWLADRFEENRAHRRAVLPDPRLAERGRGRRPGSLAPAQPVRLQRRREPGRLADDGRRAGVLEHVADAQVTHEEPRGAHVPDEIVGSAGATHPEEEAVLADSVGRALLVILDTLAPAERLAFVLHDMFAVPFDEIAPIVDRTPAATRQLASRARRRVQGADRAGADRSRQREVVAAFLAASRNGQFDALLVLLDPDVVLRADPAVVAAGASAEVVGSSAVAGTFSGRARAARPALVDRVAGAVWTTGGRPRVVFGFTISHGKILGLELIGDPVRLSELDLVFLDE